MPYWVSSTGSDACVATGHHGRSLASTGGGHPPLSEIIAKVNNRFGTAFTDTDRLLLEQIHQDGVQDDDINQTVQANPYDKFELGIRPILKELIIKRMDTNDDFINRVFTDPNFEEIVLSGLARSIYADVTAKQQEKP